MNICATWCGNDPARSSVATLFPLENGWGKYLKNVCRECCTANKRTHRAEKDFRYRRLNVYVRKVSGQVLFQRRIFYTKNPTLKKVFLQNSHFKKVVLQNSPCN